MGRKGEYLGSIAEKLGISRTHVLRLARLTVRRGVSSG